MRRAIDDEKLTAYLLGELDASEKKKVEMALKKDPQSKAALKDLESAADAARKALATDDGPALSSDQRKAVKNAGKAAGGGASPFSLGNLNDLTADKEAEDVEVDAEAKGGPEEASGLMDIRTLAAAAAQTEDSGLMEVIGLEGAGLSPVESEEAKRKGLVMKVVYGAGAAVFVILLIVVAVWALSGSDDEKSDRNRQIAMLQKKLDALSTSGNPEDTAAMELVKKQLAEAQAAKEEDGPETDEKKADEKKASGTSKSKRKSGSSSKKSASSSGSSSGSSAPKASPAPSRKSSTSELDDLLGGGGSRPKKKASPSKSSSSSGAVKASLSRSDVQKGMGGVAGRVKRCGQGKKGTVTLKVVIGRTGRVMSASPTGAHAGTAVGSCAARAVRGAKFPATKKSLTVSYPFKL